MPARREPDDVFKPTVVVIPIGTTGEAYLQDCDLSLADGWFAEFYRLTRPAELARAAAGGFYAQAVHATRILTALQWFYLALNLPIACDPDWEEVWQQYFAGVPVGDTEFAEDASSSKVKILASDGPERVGSVRHRALAAALAYRGGAPAETEWEVVLPLGMTWLGTVMPTMQPIDEKGIASNVLLALPEGPQRVETNYSAVAGELLDHAWQNRRGNTYWTRGNAPGQFDGARVGGGGGVIDVRALDHADWYGNRASWKAARVQQQRGGAWTIDAAATAGYTPNPAVVREWQYRNYMCCPVNRENAWQGWDWSISGYNRWVPAVYDFPHAPPRVMASLRDCVAFPDGGWTTGPMADLATALHARSRGGTLSVARQTVGVARRHAALRAAAQLQAAGGIAALVEHVSASAAAMVRSRFRPDENADTAAAVMLQVSVALIASANPYAAAAGAVCGVIGIITKAVSGATERASTAPRDSYGRPKPFVQGTYVSGGGGGHSARPTQRVPAAPNWERGPDTRTPAERGRAYFASMDVRCPRWLELPPETKLSRMRVASLEESADGAEGPTNEAVQEMVAAITADCEALTPPPSFEPATLLARMPFPDGVTAETAWLVVPNPADRPAIVARAARGGLGLSGSEYRVFNEFTRRALVIQARTALGSSSTRGDLAMLRAVDRHTSVPPLYRPPADLALDPDPVPRAEAELLLAEGSAAPDAVAAGCARWRVLTAASKTERAQEHSRWSNDRRRPTYPAAALVAAVEAACTAPRDRSDPEPTTGDDAARFVGAFAPDADAARERFEAAPGAPVAVRFVWRNTGSVTWTPATHFVRGLLLAVPATPGGEPTPLAASDFPLPAGTVPPGGNLVLVVPGVAPPAGRAVVALLAVARRGGSDGHEVVGQSGQATIAGAGTPGPAGVAELVRVGGVREREDGPLEVTAGARYELDVTVRNTSAAPWAPDATTLRIDDATARPPGAVAPGASWTARLHPTAPAWPAGAADETRPLAVAAATLEVGGAAVLAGPLPLRLHKGGLTFGSWLALVGTAVGVLGLLWSAGAKK